MKITLEDHKRLKSCPVCGNTGPSFYCNGGVYQIICGRYHCDLIYSVSALDKETAIETWNNLPERRKVNDQGNNPNV